MTITPRRPTRPQKGNAAKTPRAGRRRSTRHDFAELDASLGDAYPLHEILHRDRTLRELSARVDKLARVVERQVATPEWMALTEARAALHRTAIEVAFNAGVDHGMQIGLTNGLQRLATSQGKDEDELRSGVRALLMKGGLPPMRAALPLLELAWVLLAAQSGPMAAATPGPRG